VKYLGKYVNGYPFKPSDWGTVGRPILRIQDLSAFNSEPNRFAGEIPARYLIRRGDILISWSASLGVYRWDGEDSWLNQHIFKVQVDQTRLRERFFVWLAEWFINEMDREVHGSTMQHLTADAFGSFPVLLPPDTEQLRIADYLDRETARLDALVAAKERLIGLLAEKRRALITRAVTRGLDLRASLRDSGIPWLGEIPAHWRLVQFKHVTTRVDVGIAEAATHAYSLEGVPLIRSANLRAGVIDTTDMLFIEEWFAERNRSKYLFAGDIVTVRTGNTGVSAVLPPALDRSQCFTMLISTLVPVNLPQFFCYFLNSDGGQQFFRLEALGAAQDNISVPILKETPVPVPALEEQRAIVAYIIAETDKLDAVRAATEHTIVLLRERRAALIAAAVTGNIDVEEAVA
jgi:type I restriction enzyme S subunit